MSGLNAFFYDGRSPERHAVTVRFAAPGYITIQELGAQLRFRLEQLEVRPRISQQPAVVDLPGGARLEINDAESFYRVLESVTGARQWQHVLESRWSVVAAILLITAAFGWLVYAQGVPTLARWLAYSMPDEVSQTISRQGLQSMDRNIFGPSKLRPERRQRIRAAMEDVIHTVGGRELQYSLQFRGGDKVGVNAYSFPSGTIIFTDALVRLVDNTDELRAIMAHEIGHARNHHTLQMLIRKSLLAGLVVIITGDAASVGGMAAALPEVLLEASFSREFEYEADAVAREYLLAKGKPLTIFADVMSRIAARSAGGSNVPSLLDTHPAANERIRAFLD